VLGEALRAVAVPFFLLVPALLFLPGPVAVELGRAGGPALTADVERAYRWLALVALAGGGATTLVLRWLRGPGGGDEQPLVELPESHVVADEVLEPPAFDDPRYARARGRIIRAYLRFRARAEEVGFRLERHLTPREIQHRIRRPEDALETLTGLFMDARYGPDEPAPDGVRRAEAASREVCSSLHR
jgi:hypothetical protein